MARLLYDADCGFCTRSAAWLRRRGLRARIEPLQQADLPALGVDAVRAKREIPHVDDSGQVSYGAEAIGRALQTGGLAWRGAGWLLAHPPVLWLARPVYALVAANRHRLPGSTDVCRPSDGR